MPTWHDSAWVCALADDERHLGHIVKDDGAKEDGVKEGGWVAFDATHPGETGQGIRHLGTFSSVVAAKQAVERSVAVHNPMRAPRTFVSAAVSIQ
jgi:hypothetical protein